METLHAIIKTLYQRQYDAFVFFRFFFKICFLIAGLEGCNTSIKIYIFAKPEQLRPSPEYPTSHVHMKDPTVLLHVAFR